MGKFEDKIYDAYYSEKDSVFRKKVRERVHWVCSKTYGEKVLDIGCSQGITSIILGREGKHVRAVDISEQAINDAKENLGKEEIDTQKCVTFERANFMLMDIEEKFDTVILGEVLEHITDVRSFFNKAVSLMKEHGELIITTPFGINDFPDHKRTFYLKDFLTLQSENLKLKEIKFFGKWIGVIYGKNVDVEERVELDLSLLERFENAVFDIERNAINNENKLRKRISNNKDLIQEDSKKSEKEIFAVELAEIKELYNQEKLEKAHLQKELIDQYTKEETLLKNYDQLYENMVSLQKRYNNLKNSKLGKLTTKYWNIRKGKRS